MSRNELNSFSPTFLAPICANKLINPSELCKLCGIYLPPGPIVLVTVTLLKYCPFALEGFALMIASISVLKLSFNCSAVKGSLSNWNMNNVCFVRRYSILPALISLTAFVTSIVTVPAFGFSISPFGPRTRPRRPTTPIISGVATTTSNSNHPSFWIFGISSSPPTKSAPAASV